MTPFYRRLAWTAAFLTYALIVLGAWVRITDSGMGCGDHWPLCNGHVIPRLDDPATLIEWSHRLVVTIVTLPIVALAIATWRLRRRPSFPDPGSSRSPANPAAGPATAPNRAAYLALALVVLAAALGRATVILELPPWTVILHFGTAILLLATLIVAARGGPVRVPGGSLLVLIALAFATLLLGALTANLGAAGACTGFPLCNGQFVPRGGALQHLHWAHRLVAYVLAGWVVGWSIRARGRQGSLPVLFLVMVQVIVAVVMVLSGLPAGLQAAHAAVGVALWGVVVAVATAVGEARGAGASAPLTRSVRAEAT